MPRPLTLNAVAKDRLLKALRAGSSLRDAAGFAGVPWRTFCDWLKAGRIFAERGPEAEGADGRFAELVDEVDQVTREANVLLVGYMHQRARVDWRAAEALLRFRAEAPARRQHLAKLTAETKLARKRAGSPLSLPEIREMLPPRLLALLLASYTDEELAEATALLGAALPSTEPSAGG